MTVRIAPLLLLALGDVAFAADATDMPPAMRVDVSVVYTGVFDFAGLEQEGQDVGRRDTSSHTLDTTVTFAPVDGIALWVSVPATLSRTVKFVDAQQMLYDPITKTGVMGGTLDDPPVYKGSGLTGLWFGVALAPYAERYQSSHQVSWRIDLAYRTRVGRSFYDQGDGSGGAALGAHAFKVNGAFSADNGRTSPYLVGSWLMETRRPVDVPDSAGELTEVQVKPGMHIDFTGGLEIVVSKDQAKEGVRTAIDLHASFGYRTWSNAPSGFLLPSVLPESLGLPATRSEHMQFGGGLGLIADVHPYFGMRFGGEAAYVMPHTQEHFYPVRASAVVAAARVELIGRYR